MSCCSPGNVIQPSKPVLHTYSPLLFGCAPYSLTHTIPWFGVPRGCAGAYLHGYFYFLYFVHNDILLNLLSQLCSESHCDHKWTRAWLAIDHTRARKGVSCGILAQEHEFKLLNSEVLSDGGGKIAWLVLGTVESFAEIPIRGFDIEKLYM
jgi:hypothetical protein